MQRRKLAPTLAATAILTLLPIAVEPAYAAQSTGSSSGSSTSSPSSAATGSAQQQPNQPPGHDAGLRPGANPADPGSHPFVPSGQTPAPVGVRGAAPTAPPLPPGQSPPNAQATLTDLAQGMPYTVATQWPDQAFANTQNTAFPDKGQLTNGQFASLNFQDPQWVGFYRQNDRSIVVNLGASQNIRSLSLDFLQNSGDGIFFPQQVTYYVSQTGAAWHPVGSVATQVGTWSATPQTQAFTLAGLNVHARYVEAVFDARVWAFADQFSVYGYSSGQPAGSGGQQGAQGAGGVTAAPSFGQGQINQPVGPPGFLTSAQPNSGGVANMMLAYTDGYGTLGTWTESDFLPMVANISPSGAATGWLFNSVLMLNYGNLPATASGWSGYMQNLFSPNIQLSALNQAVGAAKTQLSDPAYKENVVIGIPSTDANPTNFGSIAPSGPNLDMNPAVNGQMGAYQAKSAAISWYISTVLQDWKQAGYTNLHLAGFYWLPESIDLNVQYDTALIQQTAQDIHQAHRLFYWIPFYGAAGIREWKNLGFDAAILQPNVSFFWNLVPQERLQNVAQLTQFYHMGVEIEANWAVLSANETLAQTAQNKYLDYFTGGNVYGYEGAAVKAYYLNSKTLLEAYQNANPFYNRLYGDTAQFINGAWTQTHFY